jgi:hypothetical protein
MIAKWLAIHGRRLAPIIGERVVPTLVAATALSLVLFSDVNLDLYFLSGPVAGILLLVYGAVALGLAFFPHIWMLHRIGFPLGIVAWIGRAGGFIDLAFGAADSDEVLLFIANATERILIVALLAFWHTSVIVHETLQGRMK